MLVRAARRLGLSAKLLARPKGVNAPTALPVVKLVAQAASGGLAIAAAPHALQEQPPHALAPQECQAHELVSKVQMAKRLGEIVSVLAPKGRLALVIVATNKRASMNASVTQAHAPGRRANAPHAKPTRIVLRKPRPKFVTKLSVAVWNA